MVNYTAVIRTLGTAGDKYQRLLNSLMSQTFPPQAILVYIAKGFPIPQETVGVERYIYVDKGMTAQRALRYEEVTTEYMLCLDDDLEFPPDTVEIMFALLKSHSADVVSPDIFPNHLRASHSELMMTIAGRMRPRFRDNYWGYKVMTTAGYSYNKYPRKEAYFSQTNAGACFLCKKEDFLKIDFEDELWMDKMQYPIGEDQTMYYKMHCRGLKVLTWYGHQFIHLDAGNNMTREKEMRRLYGDVFYKIVFWHRFLYIPQKSIFKNVCNSLSIIYYVLFTLLISLVKCDIDVLKSKLNAVKDALTFIDSEEYKTLPRIVYNYE